MKHQPAICVQKLANMKIGITEAQRYLDIFIFNLTKKIKTIDITEKDIEELEEIQSFLDWVKNN